MTDRAKVLAYAPQSLKLIYSAQVCADCCYSICMSQDEHFEVLANPDADPGICESCGKG